MTRCMRATIIFLVSLIPLISRADLPTGMTADQFNALVALETSQHAIETAGLFLGSRITNQTVGSWSGTLNSYGWSLQFNGSLNGAPLTINQLGTLDLSGGVVNFTNSGTINSVSFSLIGDMLTGINKWGEKASSNLIYGIEFRSEELIRLIGFDWDYAENWSIQNMTQNGTSLDPAFVDLSTLTTSNLLTYGLSSIGTPGSSATFPIAQDGIYDSVSHTFQLTTSVVPEHSSMAIVAAALAVFACLRKRPAR